MKKSSLESKTDKQTLLGAIIILFFVFIVTNLLVLAMVGKTIFDFLPK